MVLDSLGRELWIASAADGEHHVSALHQTPTNSPTQETRTTCDQGFPLGRAREGLTGGPDFEFAPVDLGIVAWVHGQGRVEKEDLYVCTCL